MSPKPQTTRLRLTGVLTEDDTQIGFVDTPGIFAPRRRLDRAMVKAAWQSLEDADAAVLVIDAARPDERIDEIVAELKKRKQRVIVALNKSDKMAKVKLLPLAAKFGEDAGIRRYLHDLGADRRWR